MKANFLCPWWQRLFTTTHGKSALWAALVIACSQAAVSAAPGTAQETTFVRQHHGLDGWAEKARTPEALVCNKGYQLLRITQYDQAIPFFNQALMINPKYVRAITMRGMAYLSTGRFQQAIADYTRAIALSKNTFNCYRRGVAYLEWKKFKEGIDDLTIFIDHCPDKSDDAYCNALKARATAYVLTNQFEKSIADLNAMEKIRPQDFRIYEIRAENYRRLGKLDLAINDYTNILKHYPDDEEVLLARGQIYMLQGRNQLALADFSTAIDYQPSMEELYRERAKVYEKMGKRELALNDRKKADQAKRRSNEL
jgi:tetratricopeptide (TPR) repeat protein